MPDKVSRLMLPTSKNPLLPGLGVCDPHIRIQDNTAYLYAGHDASPESDAFVMEDWWIWKTHDLIDWSQAGIIRPEQTYQGRPFQSCWAGDAVFRNGKAYFYFSLGPREIGVLEGETPTGPWRDVLGKPLIPEGSVATEARDPGLFIDVDGQAYIVFGTWDFYIARLGEDMVSLADTPRKLTIHNPEGPYGKGKTDDKPFLHKRGGIYYLSWGCFYGMSDSVYGPFDCRGSIIQQDRVEAGLQYHHKVITFDRHGSFFDWHGQWYFICNDMSRSGNDYFRDTSLSYVHYRSNGEIEPVYLEKQGVRLPQ